MSIQWYPGHMAKAMRKLGEYLALVDLVVEVVDARVPHSGRNPMLDDLAKRRRRVIVLTREDLADATVTQAWLERFAREGLEAVATDGRAQPSVARVARAMKRLAPTARGRSRAMVVGIPNAGKSSIVNGLLRRAAAKTENRAGVTRQLQWFRLPPNLELLDTPGILVPKIATPQAQWMLALSGALPRARYDPEAVATAFHRWLLATDPSTQVPDLNAFALARGFAQRGEAGLHDAAQSYVRAFNDGTFGRISLERPDDDAAA